MLRALHGEQDMVRRTKEQAEATREQLLDAAEALFCERGVMTTTLDQIARAAGVTRGAVYWHFGNKAEIFEAVFNRATSPLDAMLDALAADPGDDPLGRLEKNSADVLVLTVTEPRVRSVLAMLYRGFDQSPDFVDYMAREEASRQACRCKIETVIQAAIRAGQLAGHPPAADVAAAIMAFIGGLMHDWVLNQKYDLARLAPWMVATFFKGLRAS